MILGAASQSSAALTGSDSEAAKAKLDEDLNQFLTLLVTQLQNQDPLDPMDATEFTSQLVQFASVEQQIYQNSNLEKMLNLQETSQIASMVDFIGNQVEFFSQELPLSDGYAEFSYVMPAGVSKGSINIANSSGLNVFYADADTSIGKHTVKWDGMNKNNQQLGDGTYTLLVTGQDSSGNLVEIEHLVVGPVTGAGVDDGIVKLFINGAITIEQDKILSVRKGLEPVASE
ncbi:MAG: flagellar hook assembly protein FlgD [Rhodospirillales bacterium]|nr:flagellar hook assembly protein FlgD [Rhodospirillales bacterium]